MIIPLLAGLVAMTATAPAPKPSGALPLAAEQKIYGFVQNVRGGTLTIKNRSGHTIIVDFHAARANVRVYRGRPIIVFGTTDAGGVMHATAVWRTYPDAAHWPADR